MTDARFYPIPHWAPLYTGPPTRPPFLFNGCKTISLVCSTTRDALRAVTPYPLEVLEETEPVFYLTATKCNDEYGYPTNLLCVLDVPVTYNGETGMTTAIEYFNTDRGCAGGREFWGYPKKVGDIDWRETDLHLHVECRREGHTLLMIDFDKGDEIPAAANATSEVLYMLVRPATVGMVSDTLEVVGLPTVTTTSQASLKGSSSLRLFDGPNDPLCVLGSGEVVSAQLDFSDMVMPTLGSVLGSVEMPAGSFASRAAARVRVG